jgi:hypothetical protein
MLAYRPHWDLKENGAVNWKMGKFVRADSQDWAKDLPIGSHRMNDEWHLDCYDWCDKNGRPLPADWSQIMGATTEADLAELDYCSKEMEHQQNHKIWIGDKRVEIAVLDVHADAQNMIPGEQLDDYLNPKERRLKQLANRAIADKDKKANARHQRYLERLKMKECLTVADETWRLHLNSALAKATRGEILRKLQPGVKGKKGSKMDQKERSNKTQILKNAKTKIFKFLQKKNKDAEKMKGKTKTDENKKEEKDSDLALVIIPTVCSMNYHTRSYHVYAPRVGSLIACGVGGVS